MGKLSVSKREGEGGPSKCCWSTKTARSAKPGIPCQRQLCSYETSDLHSMLVHTRNLQQQLGWIRPRETKNAWRKWRGEQERCWVNPPLRVRSTIWKSWELLRWRRDTIRTKRNKILHGTEKWWETWFAMGSDGERMTRQKAHPWNINPQIARLYIG